MDIPQNLGFTEELFEGGNIQKLMDIAKQSKISNETAELNTLDKKRDEEVVYLLTAIKNERKTPIEAGKRQRYRSIMLQNCILGA